MWGVGNAGIGGCCTEFTRFLRTAKAVGFRAATAVRDTKEPRIVQYSIYICLSTHQRMEDEEDGPSIW